MQAKTKSIISINSPVEKVSGVGPEIKSKLKKLGIKTVYDLIYHFPRKYIDYSQLTSINELAPGLVTIKGKVSNVTSRHSKRGLHITQAVFSDSTGKVKAVWFNQPYRAKAFRTGVDYYVSGEFDFASGSYSLLNPSVELASSFTKNTARIVPVYSETKGIKSHQLRKLVYNALKSTQITETLPANVISKNELISLTSALWQMHFPDSTVKLQEAKKRLGFEEVLAFSLAALLNKSELSKQKASPIKFDLNQTKRLLKSFGFELTASQKQVSWEVIQDLASNQPMNRLVEGDVGSGKTVVAAMAALQVLLAGKQVAIMAPTEILAKQHHKTFSAWFKDFDHKPVLLVSSTKPKQKQKILNELQKGNQKLVIGTHALFQEQVNFNDMGLIIIDEQHRFGVKQREQLLAKSKYAPHVLTMSATPIPRSLALTLYGELDISAIKQLPAGRKPVITKVYTPSQRHQLEKEVDQQISMGHQVFVVCPLISDSDKLGVKSVEAEYERLQSSAFKHRKIALLHGKLDQPTKDKIMKDFASGKYDILVSTTVIEVGVDVPNANVMLIEGAERFGLSQLHQLRGRVGRSESQAYCYLIPSEPKPIKRLSVLSSVNDGFKLAEIDLQMRGPGQIYGSKQHGLLDLRVAKLSDVNLIQSARKTAEELVAKQDDLLQYPRLLKKVESLRLITSLN